MARILDDIEGLESDNTAKDQTKQENFCNNRGIFAKIWCKIWHAYNVCIMINYLFIDLPIYLLCTPNSLIPSPFTHTLKKISGVALSPVTIVSSSVGGNNSAPKRSFRLGKMCFFRHFWLNYGPKF